MIRRNAPGWIATMTLLCLAPLRVDPALAQGDPPADRTAEVERKLDAVLEELDRMKMGGVADTARYQSRRGFGPAASKVYGISRGVAIGGYGEVLYENFDKQREDDQPSGRLDRLDVLRQIVYIGYKFSDDLLFNSEIEFEHAGILDEAEVEGEADLGTGDVEGSAELTGEVVLEFAYLDWAFSDQFGVRAGLLLVPMGWTNELHEPPIFLGARRPDVDRSIIPTTWRANGAGIYGEFIPGLTFRAYLMEGLDARGFNAVDGIRGGRQGGSRALPTKPALTARVDFSGLPLVTLGMSGYTGDSWQDFQPAATDLSPRVTLHEFHARLDWRALQMQGLYARGQLDDALDLSNQLGLTGSAMLGESFSGSYIEAGYDVLAEMMPGSRYSVIPYLRWESFDTQDKVPLGGTENPANERTVVTAGLGLKPHPNVVLKMDRQFRSNQAETEVPQWNVALGYMF